MDEAYYQQSRANWHSAQQSIITAEQIQQLHPLLDMDSVLGGIYNTQDGHIDPYSVTMSLAKGARMHGAEIYQQSPVLDLKLNDKGRWDVETEYGTLEAGAVINCTGFWGRELAQMVGIDLPLCTIEHQYVITDSIPQIEELETELPVIRDLEKSYYCRQERQGLLVGPYESAELMKVRTDWQKDGVPSGFDKELYEPDLDRIMSHVMGAMERIPAMENAGIQNITSGPICYTPDVLPIVGPVQGLPNFWVANGMSYGIAHAGGIGDYLAQWILDGEPPFDLTELDPTRYGKWTTPFYTAAKAREGYGDNNLITHPYIEKPAGRPIRYPAMYHQLKLAGAEFGFHNGWEQPHWYAKSDEEAGYQPSFYRTNWFEPVRREVNTVMNHVGVIDLTPFSKYIVSGPGSRALMEKMCANIMPKVGRVNICHMLTPKGRVMAELTVTRLAPDRFYIITGSGVELHDLRWLETHAPDDGSVSIQNLTGSYAVLGVVGPNSRALLQKLTHSNLDNEAFKFLSCQEINLGPVPVWAIRISFTGELGWELHFPIEYSSTLYDILMDAGQDLHVDNVGTYAVNSLRLEKGFRVWGSEMNKDTNPLEAGLGGFIRTNKKTPFLGQKAIESMLQHPLKRQLVMLSLADTSNIDPTGNEAVWLNGKVVGNTTSGGYGYVVNKSLAFAYVPTAVATPGTQLDVELVGKMYKATVEREPLVETHINRSEITF